MCLTQRFVAVIYFWVVVVAWPAKFLPHPSPLHTHTPTAGPATRGMPRHVIAEERHLLSGPIVKTAAGAKKTSRPEATQDAREFPWALRQIAMHPDVGSCAALHQLLHVADEKWRKSLGSDDSEVEVLMCRLVEWPLPVLARCSSILRVMRGMLRGWIAEAEAAVPRTPMPSPMRYRRLYNICLWQRRHPLFILGPVLDAFGETLPCEEMDGMLEALSQHLVSELNGVPHLLRCDVLMTYSRLPFAEQHQLMEAFRTCYLAAEVCELTPPPEFYLSHHMSRVPPRFGGQDLRVDEYEEVRRAFELHKRAGVRRLFSCSP